LGGGTGRSCCWRSAAQYLEQLLREEVSDASAGATAGGDGLERTGRQCWRTRSATRRLEQLQGGRVMAAG
jgi:hypothetical protein